MQKVAINGRYKVFMTEHLASWDALAHWERERFASMESLLSKGDILFDVGTEQGTLSAVYAGFVGAENMCLFEPSVEFWPLIKYIWDLNKLPTPMACFQGFVDKESTKQPTPTININAWPEATLGKVIGEGMPYKYLHNEKDMLTVRSTSIDHFVNRTDIEPTALTIDVEGAEMRVLAGATKTLNEIRPLVWVSIHPDLMQRDYQMDDSEVHSFMEKRKYTGRHLETDHEQHWLFWPRECPDPPITGWGQL